MKKGQVLRSLLLNYGNNCSPSQELASLFGNLIFDYAKPVELIKLFSKLTTSADDIILDFFSGSVTTAQAFMQLNNEDGGNRKFIIVQLSEPCDEKSEVYKAGYVNIKEDCTDLARLFGCILECGLPLSLPYTSEEIDDCTVHAYNDGDLIIDEPQSVEGKQTKEQLSTYTSLQKRRVP